MKNTGRHEKFQFDLGRVQDPQITTMSWCRKQLCNGAEDSCIGYDHRGPTRGPATDRRLADRMSSCSIQFS